MATADTLVADHLDRLGRPGVHLPADCPRRTDRRHHRAARRDGGHRPARPGSVECPTSWGDRVGRGRRVRPRPPVRTGGDLAYDAATVPALLPGGFMILLPGELAVLWNGPRRGTRQKWTCTLIRPVAILVAVAVLIAGRPRH